MENSIMEIHIEKKLVAAGSEMDLNICTHIEAGKISVLFGESGAGKSTLLRIIAGLTLPDRGFIRSGKKVWYDSSAKINIPPQLRDVGFMFQDYALFPNMTVYENIVFGQKKKNTGYACALMDKFGLHEIIHRKPGKLSGGQMQRVALARALAREPSFLLLDEPLSALDQEMRTSLQNEILKAHEWKQSTTILVSHDLSEVYRLADTVIHINKGSIIKQGGADSVFNDRVLSSKVQITGTIVKIEKPGVFYLLTIITGMNQLIKVTALYNDIRNLSEGDRVLVFTKAFNPVIMKVDR
jgi:molybdate transport system ATP-binding protein